MDSIHRNFLSLLICTFLMVQSTFTQTKWGTEGKYLTQNGKQIYLSGVNYIVSDGWMINLPDLSQATMNADMAALQSIGVNHVRFFPMWHLTQPTINQLDEKVMKQLDKLVQSAGNHKISMQIAPITGFMSGGTFLPQWAVGDVFRDQKIIDGQKYLSKTIAQRYKNNPNVLGYDFGNELNVLVGRVGKNESRAHTPEETFSWMKQIYPAFKNASPNQLVTNGIGTGYNSNFDIRNIAQTADYLAPHSYVFFHGTVQLDPWFGQRTTYSSNFITSWCEMMAKPVVIQEIGCAESWLPPAKIGAFLRLNFLSTWADGAAGFLWWSSHDIDTAFRVNSKDLNLSLSSPSFAEGKFSEMEYNLGLLNTNNSPKIYAAEFAQCVKTVDKLGFSWKDELPVCYIIVPAITDFDAAMHEFITAYALAKQAHFDVKLCYEGTPVPPDAKAVFIPGIKLTGNAKQFIQDYLISGGKVYQSYENDFGTAIKTSTDTSINTPSLIVSNPVGLMEVMLPMSIPSKISFRKTTYTAPAEAIITFKDGYRQWGNVKEGVFYKQPVGKGTYYYFSGNLEKSLVNVYNPWINTNCELLYAALKPQGAIEIDNKYVELYVKSNAGKKIVMLLNHSEQYQDVTVRSEKFMRLSNFEIPQAIGSGKEITVKLKPGEVLIASVQ